MRVGNQRREVDDPFFIMFLKNLGGRFLHHGREFECLEKEGCISLV